MKVHAEHADVQQEGCWTLTILAADADDGIAIVVGGGNVLVVTSMETHPIHTGVQQWGCLALSNLATNNADNGIAFAAAGALAWW